MKRVHRFFRYIVILASIIGMVTGILLLVNYFIKSQKSESVKMLSSDKVPKKVLFLSSFGLFNYTMDEIVQGVKEVFNDNDIVFEIDFMDCQRLSGKEHDDFHKNLVELNSLKKQKFDAVLLADYWAWDFVTKYRTALFGDIPLFFISTLGTCQADTLASNLNVSGVAEYIPFAETIECAIKFNPTAQMVYGIFDDTDAGKTSQKEFFSIAKQFPSFSFRGINLAEHTQESFSELISHIGNDSIIIFMSVTESPNFEKTPAEILLAQSKIPVFSTNRYFIEMGFLGGKVIDYESLGREGAKNVCKVLNGKEDYWYHVVFNTTDSKFMFNKKTFKKFALRKSLLPKGTEFIKQQSVLFRKLDDLLIPLALIIFSVFLIILVLCDFSYTLYRAARLDSLTGLPNRSTIHKYLEKIIARKKPFSVMLIDVLDFKTINDFNSYYCGDAVLKELSARLKGFSRSNNCFVGRHDGDKFILIYEDGVLSRNSPDIYYFRQILSNPIRYYDTDIFIRINIGIVNYSMIYKNSDEYLANADIALNEAKKIGRGKYIFYSESMKNHISENSRISKIVDEACKAGAFKVMYQPQVDARTGKLIGFEALVRLADSRLPPGTFIPVAEADGHIAKIGRIVTETVIKQLADWKRKGLPLYCVAINYSAGQFADKEYVDYLETLLKTYGIPSEFVHIEITESLFVGGKENALKLFNALDKIGVKLALDDFGTGYSSLSYLTYLPVETVKIDKSMIDTYLTNNRASFIQNITNLVHSLGMKLTVEGVEHEWQYNWLREFDVDCIQGYFFSKPLSAEEIESKTKKINV